jgi:uncharacterized membrane protein
VTVWVFAWVYRVIEDFLIGPAGRAIVRVVGAAGEPGPPVWFSDYLAPTLGVVGVVSVLYLAGLFARTKVAQLADAVLRRLPLVRHVYGAVSRAVQHLRPGSGGYERFQRVVLVPFPSPSVRVVGLVTATGRDPETGRSMLCVFVPTCPIPSSGYAIFLPAEDATDTDWTVEQALELVVSFGLTAPADIRFRETGDADPRGTPNVSRTPATCTAVDGRQS